MSNVSILFILFYRMVEAIRDRSFDWLSNVASSSTTLEKVLNTNGNCNNVSGWDELVDLYAARLQTGDNSSCPSSSRKRPGSESNGGAAEKIRIIENRIKTAKTKNNQLTCPICEYSIPPNIFKADFAVRKFVRHLRKHEGELDNSTKAPCTSCFSFHKKSKMDEHFKQEHSETERFEVREVICFTNSTHKYQKLIDSLAATLKSTTTIEDNCSRIPENSIFTGSTRMGLGKYRENCRQKFLAISDRSALFRYKYRQTSNLPFAWLCPLCDESAAVARCSSFHNDISLRLFVLRHFAVEHHNLEDIETTIQQEWAILSYEIGFDLEYHVIETAKLLRQTQRSNLFYTLRGIKTVHRDALVHEMFGRSTNKEEICASDHCICIVCFKPVLKKSLGRHLSTAGHEWLSPHAEHGEFREVAEISEVGTMNLHNFPYIALFYSKVFRIREEDDCESITFLKWRCVLESSVAGHVDDVLEFPTKELLKIHALKHFETYHQDFFSPEYYQYERYLVQCEDHCSPYYDVSIAELFYNKSYRLPQMYTLILPYPGALTMSRLIPPIQTISTSHLGRSFCRGVVTISRYVAFISGVDFLLNSLLILLVTDTLTSDSSKNGSPAARNEQEARCPDSSSANPEADVHPVEIFVPRSECSSADVSRTNDPSSTGCTEDPEIGVIEFSNVPEKEEPLFSSLVVPKGEATQGTTTIRIAASTSDSTSAANPPSTVSANNDESSTASTNTEQDVAPVYGPDNLDVQEHKLIIHRKFLWEGPPPPPLDAEQTQQLVCLARNECPFCTTARGPRGLRIPQFANDEIKEESMLAHVVKFHYKDPAARWVLNAKRFHMSTGGRQTPLKFLLEPTNDGWLLCSSCEKASFDRIANLRVHWACCVNVCGRYRKDLREGRLVLESPSTVGKLPKRRGKNEAVKCPLPTCVSAWRPSFKYPNSVTQIAHMISHHGTDKEAYETALKLGETERLAEEFPFLDVAKSFANSLNGTELCLQCVKCDRGFHSPYELEQHAKRYHPTEKHYSGAPKCPFGCSKRLQRLKSGVTDNVLRLLHVMICHLPDPDAVAWVENWMKKHESVMESEPVFKFDVRESLNTFCGIWRMSHHVHLVQHFDRGPQIFRASKARKRLLRPHRERFC
ncbi:zinc finger, C2H2 type [Cooperia oncophora]